MISPNKGRYDMLLLQPVGPSLPVTTHIQETGEQQGTVKHKQYAQKKTEK